MATHGAKTSPDQVKLYASAPKVYPKRVQGTFRRLKWVIMAITLGVYYITPWLRWDRGPFAPNQAVLVDLSGRRFFFGPIEIWPQEFYYVAGLLVMAGLGLFLLTTTVGRAWCGYSCPQTVWTDLMTGVEDRIIGDRNARMRLDRGPWTFEKIWKKAAVNISWLGIALATGGAWVFYFADAPTLLRDLLAGEAARQAYVAIGVLTFTTFALGGYMREQVCIYMCPWPRIQGAMIDEDSFIVTYKAWRGEPRGSVKEAESGKKIGDCIDCLACVHVCPTGIDIRNGPQLACITCALCIDACNDVMGKLGRAPDLIGYSTLNRDKLESSGQQVPSVLKEAVRPRTILYLGVWTSIGLAMLYVLSGRAEMDVYASQDRNPVYVQMSDGDIRNGYTVKIINKQTRPRDFVLSTEGLPNARIWESIGGETPAREMKVQVAPDALKELRVYVRVPAATMTTENLDFRFRARAVDNADEDVTEARFTGPVK